MKQIFKVGAMAVAIVLIGGGVIATTNFSTMSASAQMMTQGNHTNSKTMTGNSTGSNSTGGNMTKGNVTQAVPVPQGPPGP